MRNVHNLKRVHLVGIGGINMSAVAKLLQRAGVQVTGSDLVASDTTRELEAAGIKITVGPSDERNVSADCQAVIYSSAVPESDPERQVARHRHLQEMTNFAFLGEWFFDKEIVLVTGTHGKSTTTGLLGAICIEAGLDPTVIVGSKMPNWPDANLRIGESNLVIIEGDEYAKHFLHFHPSGLIINNIEFDHPDAFRDMDDLRHTFERLLRQTKRKAVVVANGESEEAVKAVTTIRMHEVKVIRFGRREAIQQPSQAYEAIVSYRPGSELSDVSLTYGPDTWLLQTKLIGVYNAMNIAAAATMAKELGADQAAIASAIGKFPGIWRRMEHVGEVRGVPVYSDYGHHPTAVRATLDAVRQAWPDKRIVLCFQPHHKNRTKHLFDEFVTCFDQADVLVLCEIYDVPGRSSNEDADTTSRKLLTAINSRQSSVGNQQPAMDGRQTTDNRRLKVMEYAANPEEAIRQTFELLKSGDVCIVMGAGDIDASLRKQIQNSKS